MTIGKVASELAKVWIKGRDGWVSAKAGAERGKIKLIRHHQKLCPYRI
jgi:hypothetical protein